MKHPLSWELLLDAVPLCSSILICFGLWVGWLADISLALAALIFLITLCSPTDLYRMSSGCNTAELCYKARLFPPLCSPRINVCMWHMLSETRTLIIVCIDCYQKWAFDQTCIYTQPHKIDTLGALRFLHPPAWPLWWGLAPVRLILLPAHSPAAPQPHAYSTVPTASPVTPPSPWVDYGSKAKALLGGCSISKPVWLKRWGTR